MSDSDHDRGREIAQAISEGMNCMANLRKLAMANSQPPAGCIAELDDMERAFEGVRESVRDGVVETDLVVDDALIADTRRIRDLTSTWLESGQMPQDLVPRIEAVLGQFGITAEFLDAEV